MPRIGPGGIGSCGVLASSAPGVRGGMPCVSYVRSSMTADGDRSDIGAKPTARGYDYPLPRSCFGAKRSRNKWAADAIPMIAMLTIATDWNTTAIRSCRAWCAMFCAWDATWSKLGLCGFGGCIGRP